MKQSDGMTLYDRVFRPREYTLGNGKTVKEKRSRLPLVLVLILAAIIISGEVTGFRISTLLRRISYFFVMLGDMFPPDLSYMKDFRPLSEEEMAAVWKVRDAFLGMPLIPCTACRYCTDGCPKRILIPDLFSCLNSRRGYKDRNAGALYREVFTKERGKASDCIGCGRCERACPQHLPIRELLRIVAAEFESGAQG